MNRFAWIGGAAQWLASKGLSALKWPAVLYGAEALTDKGDGKGGIFTRPIRSAADSVTTEQSAIQARNALWDQVAGTSAGVNGFLAGGLKVFVDFLADVVGIQAAKGWSQSLEKFRDNQEQKIQELRERSRSNAGNPIPGATSLVSDLASSAWNNAGTIALGTAAYLGFKNKSAIGNLFTGSALSNASIVAGPLSKISPILSKLPVLGKFLGAATVVSGVGALTMGALSPAEAAANPNAAITTSTASMVGTELTALGASFVGTNSAIAAAAPLAAGLGLKAIPGIASVVAAGETIYSTSKYALNGEWAKAGTQLVAGVGETIAGVGGMLTYGTLGTAWREAVRAGGAAVFGEDKAIDHSLAYQLADAVGLVSMFRGAADPNARPATAERAPVYANNQQALVPNLY